MLRLALLVVLLANAGYFAWSQGLLRAWGLGPVQGAEPQRIEHQINPQSLRILRDDEVRRLDSQAVVAGNAECLLAGPIQEAQLAGVREALQHWPSGSWSLDPVVEPGVWIVYMGKYASMEHVARKQAELRQIGVRFEPLSDAALGPGLSLGKYPSEGAAGEQLQALAQRGVRSAQVVQQRAEARGHLLRLASVDETLRPRLQELRPVLDPVRLRSCR